MSSYFSHAMLAALSGLLFVALPTPLPASEARTAIDAAAIDPPPYCSPREHLGKRGYLVDQAWVSYRRIERSSPLRVGWCSCAKRCEPIDFLAARYEAVAFEAKARSVDLSVPPAQRREYGRLSTEMFGKRNQKVYLFNDCIDGARPPLQPASASDGRSPASEPIVCGISTARLLEIAWARWCEKYSKEFDKIAAEFVQEFKNEKGVQARLDYWTELHKVSRDGKLVWELRYGNSTFFNMTKADALRYLKKVKAIPIPAVPAGASRTFYTWPSRMFTTEGDLPAPVDCPKD